MKISEILFLTSFRNLEFRKLPENLNDNNGVSNYSLQEKTCYVNLFNSLGNDTLSVVFVQSRATST